MDNYQYLTALINVFIKKAYLLHIQEMSYYF